MKFLNVTLPITLPATGFYTFLGASVFALVITGAYPVLAKKKVQEVNFEEMMMKGAIRNPEGAFLVQKRGLKFYPLHEVQKDFDKRIRESEPEEVVVKARRTK